MFNQEELAASVIEKAICAVAAIFFVATSSSAQDVRGNELYQYCEADDDVQAVYCYGYIAGAVDGLRGGSAMALANVYPQAFETDGSVSNALGFCLPVGVTKGQLHDVVLAYLRDHPEDRHEVAPLLVLQSLVAAFPC